MRVVSMISTVLMIVVSIYFGLLSLGSAALSEEYHSDNYWYEAMILLLFSLSLAFMIGNYHGRGRLARFLREQHRLQTRP